MSVIAIMALEAFAVFANGAYFLGPMTLCVISIWIIFITLLCVKRDNFFPYSATNITPVVLLTGLWLWSGLSFIWSIARDLTWVEFNRTGGYLAVFVVGISVSRSKRARLLGAWLFLIIVAAAGVYALGTKVLPRVVENPDDLARISIPIGYVNALGLLVALGVPLTLYFSSAKGVHVVLRLLALMIAPILLVCMFFTLSRGAFLALTVGLIVYFALVPLRLRGFFLIVIIAAPSFLIARWGSGQDAFMNNKVELGLREASAGALRIYMMIALLAMGAVFLLALVAGRYIRVPDWATRVTGGVVLIAVVATLVAGSGWFISSKPSFRGWADQTYHNFTDISGGQPGAARLFEMKSSRRWQLWQEAMGNWEENPVAGSGAQSFPLVHLMRREITEFVKQPHGLPFRLLTELGLVGFILGGAFICTTLTISMLGWSRLRDRREKGLMGALIAVTVIYLIHSSYDWDWNMFALTMPYMFFTGILVGWPQTPKPSHLL